MKSNPISLNYLNCILGIVILLNNFKSISCSTFYMRILKSQDKSGNSTNCIVLNEEFLPKERIILGKSSNISNPMFVSSFPAFRTQEQEESPSLEKQQLVEIFSRNETIAKEHLKNHLCAFIEEDEATKEGQYKEKTTTATEIKRKIEPEVVKLLNSNGDNSSTSTNRIDVVFMGDGYTFEEREKFFLDTQRLIQGTFISSPGTFKNFLPLLNIWGIFVPSLVSGIGYNGQTKNTPFKLYRNKGPLRSVFTKNPAYARSVCKLTGPSGCDYPILLANDDYYGGLGGEFAITTSSERSGIPILRHELGHNFAKIGEEYDSGEVYIGANSSPYLRRLKWTKWLTNQNIKASQLKEERLTYRILTYPKNNLDIRPLAFNFRSNGAYSNWYLFLTFSGIGDLNSIQVLMNGKPLEFLRSEGNNLRNGNSSGVGLDKIFLHWSDSKGLAKGQHSLEIKSLIPTIGGTGSMIPRMVGSVGLYEYGNNSEYHLNPEYISAYPTWDSRGRKRYRPTNAGCLMRNMSHPKLCSVCNEEIWLQFFQRISLIDELKVGNGTEEKTVTLTTLKLGQFRSSPTQDKVEGEYLEINWFRNGKEQKEFKGMTKLIGLEAGNWSVRVKFITLEVRNDPKALLTENKKFVIK